MNGETWMHFSDQLAQARQEVVRRRVIDGSDELRVLKDLGVILKNEESSVIIPISKWDQKESQEIEWNLHSNFENNNSKSLKSRLQTVEEKLHAAQVNKAPFRLRDMLIPTFPPLESLKEPINQPLKGTGWPQKRSILAPMWILFWYVWYNILWNVRFQQGEMRWRP